MICAKPRLGTEVGVAQGMSKRGSQAYRQAVYFQPDCNIYVGSQTAAERTLVSIQGLMALLFKSKQNKTAYLISSHHRYDFGRQQCSSLWDSHLFQCSL